MTAFGLMPLPDEPPCLRCGDPLIHPRGPKNDPYLTHVGCCTHDLVEKDDDGLADKWFFCPGCGSEVALSEPDEDGKSIWEVVS